VGLDLFKGDDSSAPQVEEAGLWFVRPFGHQLKPRELIHRLKKHRVYPIGQITATTQAQDPNTDRLNKDRLLAKFRIRW